MKYLRLCFYTVFLGIFIVASCKNKANNTAADNNDPIFQQDPQLKAVTAQINENPKSAELYYTRGQLLQTKKMDSLAIADYKKAASLDTGNSIYYSAVGGLLFDHKDFTSSAEWLRKALNHNPKDINAHLKIATLFIYTGDYPKAFNEINIVLRQDVYNSHAYFLKGMAYKELKDTGKAISSFQTALQMNPRYREAIAELGEMYSAKKDTLALSYFDNMYKLDTTDVFPLYARGMFYQAQNNFEKAKDEYENCIDHDPQYADAYFAVGWILMHQDSLEKARRQFDLVTKIAPTNAGAYYNRGLCSELMHNKQDAISDYQQALVFDNNYKEAREGLKRLKAK